MDDLAIGGPELTEALAQLRVINRVLGATAPTIEGVAHLWRRAGRPMQLHVLDVGAGSGEFSRQLLAWAARQRVEVQITLLDINAETCATATVYHRDTPQITVQHGDLFALPTASADIITASLFLHHIADPLLPTALLTMARAARIGVVINDLHRHRIAWLAIWLATQLLSRNRMIRHDAPLSVQRGFCAADFERLRAVPELARLWYAWRPLFRYLVLIPGRGTHDPCS
jgi:2-polyprenyl-3-methyl-5-hydroxy-6-metoxy-1,4-benzoquinol methylase